MNSSVSPRKFWTATRVAFTLITFALLATISFSSCSTPTSVSNDNRPSATNDGKPTTPPAASNPNNAPAGITPLPATVMNAEVKLLDGSSFKLADYRGKVTLVNLWATWCGPCRSEIPDLIKVSEEFKAQGLEVIGLTTESEDIDLEKVKDFVSEFRIPYKIGWSNETVAYGLMQGQIKNNIPQSFIISRDGRVLKRFVGYSPVETPPKLRKALEEAVNSK
jgi:thiol-disulfide isomerase/thioredoxin